MDVITNIFDDNVIRCIATFTKERLNDYGQEMGGIDIVNGIRLFQDFGTGLHEFPLLRVYRVSDTFVPQAGKVESFVNMDYCLPYPYQSNLAGVANTITKYMHRIVNRLDSEIHLGVNKSRSRTGGYRIIDGGNTQSVFAVITYTFSIIEGT